MTMEDPNRIFFFFIVLDSYKKNVVKPIRSVGWFFLFSKKILLMQKLFVSSRIS
jgi:hypothetical protein